MSTTRQVMIEMGGCLDRLSTTVVRLADENKRLRDTLRTANMLVSVDAADAPGRVSMAIRPFLADAVERFGITTGDDRS